MARRKTDMVFSRKVFLVVTIIISIIFGIYTFKTETKRLSKFKTLRYKDGGFTISMHHKPIRETETVLVSTVPTKITSYYNYYRKSKFTVAYGDLPQSVIDELGTEKMLENSRNGIIKRVNGKLLDDRKFNFNGYPAIEFKFNIPDDGLVYQIRLFLVKRRFYQLHVVSEEDKILPAMSSEFLESFRLIQPYLCEIPD